MGTRGRTARLGRTLDAWSAVRSDAPWELIIVDNNDGDETWDALQTWQDRLPLRLTRERRRGVTSSRNTGAALATGGLLAFIDDDCYPSPGLVDAWIGVFADARVDYAAGRIELFDTDDLPITIKTSTEPVWYPPLRVIPPGEIHSASMAIRRQLFFDIGGFDPDLGPGTPFFSGDDTELFQRASVLGLTGRYSPEAEIWHHHGRRGADLAGLQHGYDVGAGGAFGCIVARYPGRALLTCRHEISGAGGVKPWAKRVYWSMRGFGAGSLATVAWSALRFSVVVARRSLR